ncbi:MAG TPA: tetratricopeptide repeat protein [Microthrixaceae bacterium]|nr:tetratricopeptide repeat protein [Microthrixaceae bacterium]
MTGPRFDPDTFARLEEERDHLLRSLDDLDAEREAGDLTDDEYELLRDEYTRRAATVLRSLDEQRELVPERRPRSATRTWVSVLVVVALASTAGWLVARSSGTRGAGTGLTGSGSTMRERLAECQRLFSDLDDAIACYDDVLDDEPDQLEALTYQGWALVRAGRLDEANQRFDRVIGADDTFPDVYVFRAVARKDAGDFVGAQADLDTLYALEPPRPLLTTMQGMGLDLEVALGLLPADTADCWARTATLGTDLASSGVTVAEGEVPPGFDEVLACFDAVLLSRPGDPAATALRGAAVYGIGATPHVADSISLLDEVIAASPDDPTARVVRAALAVRSGDLDTTAADVAVLRNLGRPSALVSGIESRLRDELAAMVGDDTTTTSP